MKTAYGAQGKRGDVAHRIFMHMNSAGIFLCLILAAGNARGLSPPSNPPPVGASRSPAADPACADKSGLPNHFIVLLDNSGTMDNGRLNALWNTGRRKDAVKFGSVIPHLLEKTLTQGPVWLPKPRACDFLSFATFKLDYYKPSYRLSEIFFSASDPLVRWQDNNNSKK
jgi:hypothetical protein